MIINIILYFYVIIFIISIFIFRFIYNNLLINLIILEFTIIRLLIFIYIIYLKDFKIINILYYLRVVVCERVINLTLLICLILNYGNDNLIILNLLIW